MDYLFETVNTVEHNVKGVKQAMEHCTKWTLIHCVGGRTGGKLEVSGWESEVGSDLSVSFLPRHSERC